MSLRIGIGFDIHKLAEDRKLFLGGVEIPFDKGLLGHSDGDALLHAICDALLGARALADMGSHFPDTEPEFKDISSIELLKRTRAIINEKAQCRVLNIDTIIVCDEPMLMGYIDGMKKIISAALGISAESIGIKAKTTEDTAPGVITSYASVLLEMEEESLR